MVIRQLVMDSDHRSLDKVTLHRIRGLDKCGVKSFNNILSKMTCRYRRRSGNMTMTKGSTCILLDVEDLSQRSLDDTQELCESRTDTTYQGGREKKRDRRGTRISEVVLVGEKENMNIGLKEVGEPHIY